MRWLVLVALCACQDTPKIVAVDSGALALDAQVDPARVVHRSAVIMGSQITLSFYWERADETPLDEAARAAFAEMKRLELLLSTWHADSDISKVNAVAGEAAVSVAPETFEVLEAAVRFGKSTEGKFDVTFGALSGLWKFDHDQDDRIPKQADVDRQKRLVDYRKIILSSKDRRVKLAKKGMKLHLGGIGKGYAVDKAVALLRGLGLENFMVQFGGDMYVAGRRGDRPWRVGIRDPRGPPDDYFARAEVTDASFSTSGDYERSFVADGVRYHHVLDPATGRPAMATRSVTVMAPDALTAEGISKGVFILGPEKGLVLADSVPGVGVVIVDANNVVHLSKRLVGRIKVEHPPTPGI